MPDETIRAALEAALDTTDTVVVPRAHLTAVESIIRVQRDEVAQLRALLGLNAEYCMAPTYLAAAVEDAAREP